MVREAARPAIGYLLHGPLAPLTRAALTDALDRHARIQEPDPPEGCWLDLRGGRLAETCATILATAEEWGCRDARLGVAPTPGVARLAARLGGEPLTILATEGVADFLRPLSVEEVGLSAETADRLRLIGLGTLGAIADLPSGALGTYLGPEGVALDLLARGADDRPLVPRRQPLKLRAEGSFEWPVVERAALAALVGRLAAPLLAHLAWQGLGATRATLQLHADAGGARLRARLPQPTTRVGPLVEALLTDVERILARDDGEEDGREVGITGVVLTLTAPRPLPVRQRSFFDVPSGQRGRLALGVAEARRRSDATLGYLRPVDPAHPIPERRFALDALDAAED
jgi:nucleotidyltransferase/DNA polymerase involved in DNA repair